jgi:predicted DNA-binding transcriptional regulator AlpA
MTDRTLNPEELAKEFLNIKLGTLYSHMSRGTDLPPSFRVGSQTRWRLSAVMKWIEKKEREKQRRNFES